MASLSYNNPETNVFISICFSNDADMEEFINHCKTLAIGATYQPESWNDVICQLADEIHESDRDTKEEIE